MAVGIPVTENINTR